MAALFLDERLSDPRPLYFTWSMMPGAVGAEAMARTPFEACLIDMQHGLVGFADMLAMMTAMHKAGKPVLVRPPLGDAGTQAKALDAGAAGLVVPMINTAEDARALVSTTKYPPLGERSWGAYLAVAASGLAPADYLAPANRLFKSFAMIETGLALENLGAIAATPGIDGLFVGPHDLCISLTGGAAPDARHPKVQAVLPRIVQAAREAGIVPGIYAANPQLAREFAAMGFRLIAVGSDASFLAGGAAGAHGALSAP
jgi:4-hydroxy-2-oxoheptanedioate aldolase